jgi:hypothetical protein
MLLGLNRRLNSSYILVKISINLDITFAAAVELRPDGVLMKSLIFVLLLGIFNVSYAGQWHPILTCDNGESVVDVNIYERRNLQLVIRAPKIIKYLNEAGVVQSKSGSWEIVLGGWTGHVDFNRQYGPKVYGQPYGSRGVFAPDDLKEFIANFNIYENKPFVRIVREGKGLKVQFAEIKVQGCAVYSKPENSCLEYYTEFVQRADWYFQSCN